MDLAAILISGVTMTALEIEVFDSHAKKLVSKAVFLLISETRFNCPIQLDHQLRNGSYP
jgi:hypothetical protein